MIWKDVVFLGALLVLCAMPLGLFFLAFWWDLRMANRMAHRGTVPPRPC